MALSIVRFLSNAGAIKWGLLTGHQVSTLDIDGDTTADLLGYSHDELRAATKSGSACDLAALNLLSPITENSRIFCQGANYRQHMIDSGMDPDAKRFNMFFTKSSASIHSPQGQIIKPKHVELLDYEVELTLILGGSVDSSVQVSNANLHHYIAGICIGNDVSARDIQIPQMQFYKGKSYRTFCPFGPVLCLLTAEDMRYLDDMALTLTVNGEVRQQDITKNMVFKPAETLTELSTFANFRPGDVVMTGTPSGCALGLPSPALVKITSLLPEEMKWSLFVKSQKRRPQYLKAGDRVECRIVSADGRIDLGTQKHVIVEEG